MYYYLHVLYLVFDFYPYIHRNFDPCPLSAYELSKATGHWMLMYDIQYTVGRVLHPTHSGPCVASSTQWAVCCIQYTVDRVLHPTHSGPCVASSTQWAVCCIQHTVGRVLHPTVALFKMCQVGDTCGI